MYNFGASQYLVFREISKNNPNSPRGGDMGFLDGKIFKDSMA